MTKQITVLVLKSTLDLLWNVPKENLWLCSIVGSRCKLMFYKLSFLKCVERIASWISLNKMEVQICIGMRQKRCSEPRPRREEKQVLLHFSEVFVETSLSNDFSVKTSSNKQTHADLWEGNISSFYKRSRKLNRISTTWNFTAFDTVLITERCVYRN